MLQNERSPVTIGLLISLLEENGEIHLHKAIGKTLPWEVTFKLSCGRRQSFPGVSNCKGTHLPNRRLRDTSWVPGLQRSLGGGHGDPLQNSWQENPMEEGAWRTVAHTVTESDMLFSVVKALTLGP